MKAIVRHAYGSPDVLVSEEIEKPSARDDEVLVAIEAVSLNPADWHTLRGQPFFLRLGDGIFRPKSTTLGIDIAGRVEAIGKGVTRFRPGDEVFGATKFGGLAEYARASEDRLVRKPSRLTFEEAAAVPIAATSALQALRDHGGLQPGQKALIHGASGGVGTFAVQIAKAFGAEVTGVCSTRNVDLVRSLGADRVIDYTREDCTRGDERYDLIVDAAAYRSISDYKRILGPRGIYVMVGGSVARIFQTLVVGSWTSMTSARKMSFMMARMNGEDLLFLSELLEAGKVVPVIGQRYALDDASEAFLYLGTGHARGKAVLTV